MHLQLFHQLPPLQCSRGPGELPKEGNLPIEFVNYPGTPQLHTSGTRR